MFGEVKLKWITPDADLMIAHMARVSNSKAEIGDPSSKLIHYLIKNRHWSPFEMANMCVEIHTTRDIGRQILRHRSFTFQEFSQRYSEVDRLEEYRDCRLQDSKNRQNSINIKDGTHENIMIEWENSVESISREAARRYQEAIEAGIAKECARALLPEGLVTTRMYMNGTIRSWIHYIKERTYEGVQLEHRILAEQCEEILSIKLPNIHAAAFNYE